MTRIAFELVWTSFVVNYTSTDLTYMTLSGQNREKTIKYNYFENVGRFLQKIKIEIKWNICAEDL